MTERLVIATRSSGKIRELRAMFTEAGIAVTDLSELGIAETAAEDDLEKFATFSENALAKARYFFERTRLPTVADDSGLVVDALGGLPGVHSKRWSNRPDLSGLELDQANNAKLLNEVRKTGFPSAARYVCAVAYVDADKEITTEGRTEGHIIPDPRGQNGFGYDPYFESREIRGTFGEASQGEKATVSHRGRAFRALLEALQAEG